MTDKNDNEPTLISREFALVLYRALSMITAWLRTYLGLGQRGDK